MTEEPLDRAFREEWSRMVAHLAGRYRDLSIAEEAAAEAFADAARQWPVDGRPASPGAWLMTAARRRAVDLVRRRAAAERVAEREGARRAALPPSDDLAAVEADLVVRDERLELVVACCHPALAPESRLALTLRCVAGLTTAEIARAFLVPEATVAQRIVRAKRKVRDAGIRFALPEPDQLAGRLESVRTVLYLLFSEGYSATSDATLVRPDLCDEAIWLARLLTGLIRADPESAGLLALLLLQHARAPARLDAAGRPVTLAEQDRGRWDAGMIAEGTAVLDSALQLGEPGPYQVQAAIAALHDRAPTWDATDWPQIAELYRRLVAMTGSPVAEVNRAVAVGMADGPHAGLAVLDALADRPDLRSYAPLPAARAELLRLAGDHGAARAAAEDAALLTANPTVADALRRRAGIPADGFRVTASAVHRR
jgi:RNA polymerase sigma-70 factor (ECF subfamily)